MSVPCAIFWPSWAILGAVLGPLWPLLGPSWASLGPFWGYLGPSCGLSWTILGLCGVILGDLWANLRPSGAFLELCVVLFGQLWLQDSSENSCATSKQWQNSSGTLVWTTCWPFLTSHVLCSSCLLAVPSYD